MKRSLSPETQRRLDAARQYETRLAGYVLVPGVELTYRSKLTGVKRRVRFRALVQYGNRAPWLDCWDGRQFRAVDPSSVIRVHKRRTINRKVS